MYIGSTDERGLHHLVWEVVDNSIDEAMAGHATTINVTIADGRHASSSRTTAAACRSASTRPARTPSRSSTRCSTPAASSAAAATRCRAVCTASASASSTRCRRGCASRSARDGTIWAQEYERGKPKAPVKKEGPQGTRKGTRTSFQADAEMFETIEYSFETISQRLRESAYLTKGVWITLIDERVDRERSFYFEGGLQSFVRHLNRNKEPLHYRPIYVERQEGSTAVEVALQYNDTYTENVLAFANNINTLDGGTPRHRLPGRADELAQRLGPARRRPQGQRRRTCPATTSARA